MQLTISVIAKYSASIKYLKFHYVEFQMSDFLKILSLVPNAEHLECTSLKLMAENELSIQLPSNDILNLHHLRTLEFNFCGKEIFNVFSRLPRDVLKDLTIYFDAPHLNEITALVDRQISIRILSISIWLRDVAEDDTKTQKFFYSLYGTWMEKLLSNRTKLKSLSIRRMKVGECLMNIVTNNLSDLDTLTAEISNLPAKAIRNISKLKMLKNLTIESDGVLNEFELETFAKLDNSRIINLHIKYHGRMTSFLISALAKSAPNLNVLRLTCQYDCQIMINVMRSFNFIETLQLYTIYHSDSTSSLECYDTDECFNPKLIELHIRKILPYDASFLNKFINYFPNLEKLNIRSRSPLTSSENDLIRNGFTKMRSLRIQSHY